MIYHFKSSLWEYAIIQLNLFFNFQLGKKSHIQHSFLLFDLLLFDLDLLSSLNSRAHTYHAFYILPFIPFILVLYKKQPCQYCKLVRIDFSHIFFLTFSIQINTIFFAILLCGIENNQLQKYIF